MARSGRWQRTAAAAAFVFFALLPGAGPVARAQVAPRDAPLVTDLSSHLISINSSFSGTRLIVYGAVDQPGDIIVILRGPREPAVVRRKERIFGIWANRESVRFRKVPTYYALAATRPLAEITTPAVLGRLQLGLEQLRFEPEPDVPEATATVFREALIQERLKAGLFQDQRERIAFNGPKLFRVTVDIPANVTVGTYQSEVYLLRGGQVLAAQSLPLFVNKTGFEQQMFDLSRQQPTLYGALAIVLSLAAGWTANFLLRRG